MSGKMVVALLSLATLSIGVGMGTTGCTSSQDTPEGVTVELLQGKDQFGNEVDTDVLDTLNLPISLRLLIASSEADDGYGLIITGANDSGVVSSPFPTGSVYDQPQYKYVCVATAPYPVWVYAALVNITDPSSGTLSFTKDGERNQCYLAATESCKIVVSSLSPWGTVVGEPRQFFFDENAKATVYVNLGDDTTITIGWPYRIVVVGYVNLDVLDGMVITTTYGGVEYIIGQIIIEDGVAFVVFGGDDTGLAALLQLIEAGKQVKLTCYFTTYEFTIWVTGTGPGGSTDTAVTDVTVSPTSVDVKVGASKQFTATVYPSTANQAVTWTATRGTVNANGLYTAPPTVGTDKVTAKSIADSSFKATVDINVIAADTDDGGISVIIEGDKV